MRILAIRGANLASLAAPFEVDFEKSPLVDAGLFAITGPTGSGKSTILDALCLALFDQVPRLPGGRGVPVGRASEEEALRIGSNDVRSVLRRGAGEGFAEVDFVGNDGKRYRARWDVRRARRRAEGRLQSQQLGLTRLDTNEAIGHTKTEVLHEIAVRLGLTFDQFRRSVLLAQGDFAAFLKADSDERAALLERITGTRLYSELSQAAYRRAAEEQNLLDRLQSSLAEIRPLDPEARVALEVERRAMSDAVRRTETEQEGLRAILAWHDQHQALRAGEAEARDVLEKADVQWGASAGRRATLEEVERAQPLRPRLEAFRTASKALAEAEAREASARAERDAATRTVQQDREKHATAAQQLDAARRDRDDSRGRLNEARRLDVRIETATRHAAELAARATEAVAAAQAAQARVTELDQSHDTTTRELDQALAWVRENQAWEPLAREWGRWEETLRRYARRRQEQVQVLAERRQHEQALETGRKVLVEAQAAQRAAQESVAKNNAKLEALEARADALPTEALRQEREQLDAERERVREAQRLVEEASQISARIEERSRELELARAGEAESAATLADLATQLPAKAAQLEEAGHELALALATRDEHVKHLRTLLESGSPCPVCGATEHPWAGQEVVFDGQVQGHRERLGQLDADQRALQQRQATAEAQQRQAAETVRRMTPAVEADRTRQQALARTWDHVGLVDKPPLAFTDVRLATSLAERVSRIEARLGGLADKEHRADALAHEIVQARRAVDQARDAVQATTGRVHEADRDCQALEGRLRETAVRAEHLSEELESIADTVARPLGVLTGWRDALDRDAATLIERCATRARLWAENTARREACREALAELDKTLAEARSAARSTRTAADDAERLKAAADRALADLLTARSGYFGGKPVDGVERALDAACELADVREKAASQSLSESQRKASAADQAVVATAAEMERRHKERAGAQRLLDAALDEAGTDLVRLEQRLQHDARWVAGERAIIESLREARETAATVLSERTRRRQAHEAAVPAQTRDDAAAQLQALGAQLDDRRDQLAEHIARLRQDDERRRQAAKLTGETDRQALKVKTWSALNELIGSADGKKFRVFAQSLTLEALLAHANSHLEDLSRRYRLQRVPGSDLELQVIDVDMGDEVRSVHSLSGGESFLVSLALALGLASLSSQTAQVESLFIDEGFGSLDQDALDTAIASLDTLQSLGRKVGVISHVPTLVERIGTRIRVVPRGGGRSVVEVRQG